MSRLSRDDLQPPSEASRHKVLKALDGLEGAEIALAAALNERRIQFDIIRRHVKGNDLAVDPSFMEGYAKSRDEFTQTINRFRAARHNFQRVIYEVAREEGLSIAATARAWGVSRQLVSRVLNEGPSDSIRE